MTSSAPISQWMAQLAAVAGVVLAALGVVAVALGAALYDSGALGFPIGVQIAVVVGVVGLGVVPCRMLLRAAESVFRADLTAARKASLAGGAVLLPGIGAVAAFRAFANPCWDNPGCTGGSSVEDNILKAALLVLLVSAAVALLLLPLLLRTPPRSTEQVGRGHQT